MRGQKVVNLVGWILVATMLAIFLVGCWMSHKGYWRPEDSPWRR